MQVQSFDSFSRFRIELGKKIDRLIKDKSGHEEAQRTANIFCKKLETLPERLAVVFIKKDFERTFSPYVNKKYLPQLTKIAQREISRLSCIENAHCWKISREQANEILNHSDFPDAWLYRLSEKENCFVLSAMAMDNQPVHTKLETSEDFEVAENFHNKHRLAKISPPIPLPPEIQLQIFQYLNRVDVLNAHQVCQEWNVMVDGTYKLNSFAQTLENNVDLILQNLESFVDMAGRLMGFRMTLYFDQEGNIRNIFKIATILPAEGLENYFPVNIIFKGAESIKEGSVKSWTLEDRNKGQGPFSQESLPHDVKVPHFDEKAKVNLKKMVNQLIMKLNCIAYGAFAISEKNSNKLFIPLYQEWLNILLTKQYSSHELLKKGLEYIDVALRK